MALISLPQLFHTLKTTQNWPDVPNFRSTLSQEYDLAIKGEHESNFPYLKLLISVVRSQKSHATEALGLVDKAKEEYDKLRGTGSTQNTNNQHQSSFPRHSSDRPVSRSQVRSERPNQGPIVTTYPMDRSGRGRSSRTSDLPNEEFDLQRRSKEAGYKMQVGNPNIADLSDPWRPTKIAEQYSELYDNQWTEAYEALSKAKHGSRDGLLEKDVVGILLTILQDAYSCCRAKADKQLTELKITFVDVMDKSNKSISTQEKSNMAKKLNDDLLKENRKTVAGLTIPDLLTEFRIYLEGACRDKFKLKKSTAQDVPLAKYAARAVELSWWMCVQNPPVHMCGTDRHPDPTLYRTYTKSGQTLDFYVWPALELHKDGPMLAKGTVQYK